MLVSIYSLRIPRERFFCRLMDCVYSSENRTDVVKNCRLMALQVVLSRRGSRNRSKMQLNVLQIYRLGRLPGKFCDLEAKWLISNWMLGTGDIAGMRFCPGSQKRLRIRGA